MADMVRTRVEGSITIIAVTGDIDAHTYEAVSEAIDRVLAEGKILLALDLSNVRYMSSAGIGVLIGTRSRLDQEGGKLVLIRPTPPVWQVMETFGLGDQFARAESESAAIGLLGGKPPGPSAPFAPPLPQRGPILPPPGAPRRPRERDSSFGF